MVGLEKQPEVRRGEGWEGDCPERLRGRGRELLSSLH